MIAAVSIFPSIFLVIGEFRIRHDNILYKVKLSISAINGVNRNFKVAKVDLQVQAIHAVSSNENLTSVFIVRPYIIFKASLNLSSDTLRITSLATEHLKINLRKP